MDNSDGFYEAVVILQLLVDFICSNLNFFLFFGKLLWLKCSCITFYKGGTILATVTINETIVRSKLSS